MGSIEVVYIIDGKKYPPRNTGKKVLKEVWAIQHKSRDEVIKKLGKKGHDDLVSLKEYLTIKNKEIENGFRLLQLDDTEGEIITSDDIHNLIFKNNVKAIISLREHYEDFLKLTKSPKVKLAASTIISYENWWNYIEKFIIHAKCTNISVKSINFTFVDNMIEYLREEEYSDGTIRAAINLLKFILKHAVRIGTAKYSILREYRNITVEIGLPLNITIENIMKVYNYKNYTKKEKDFIYGWLFARELGIHYVDYVQLTTEHFNEENGLIIFNKKRQKTKVMQICVLSKLGLEIFQYFGNDITKLPFNGRDRDSNFRFMDTIREKLLEILNINICFSYARDSKVYECLRESHGTYEILRRFGWTSDAQLKHYAVVDNRIMIESHIKRENLNKTA